MNMGYLHFTTIILQKTKQKSRFRNAFRKLSRNFSMITQRKWVSMRTESANTGSVAGWNRYVFFGLVNSNQWHETVILQQKQVVSNNQSLNCVCISQHCVSQCIIRSTAFSHVYLWESALGRTFGRFLPSTWSNPHFVGHNWSNMLFWIVENASNGLRIILRLCPTKWQNVRFYTFS